MTKDKLTPEQIEEALKDFYEEPIKQAPPLFMEPHPLDRPRGPVAQCLKCEELEKRLKILEDMTTHLNDRLGKLEL